MPTTDPLARCPVMFTARCIETGCASPACHVPRETCTCPDDATLDELIMVGGHWGDCPRGAQVQQRMGLPTDARALADRKRTGCVIKRGLCACPSEPYAYDRCERRHV